MMKIATKMFVELLAKPVELQRLILKTERLVSGNTCWKLKARVRVKVK